MRAPRPLLVTLGLVAAACAGPAASPPAPREAPSPAPPARAPSPASPASPATAPEPPRPSAARRPGARSAPQAASRRPDEGRRDVAGVERHEPSRLQLPPRRSSVLPGPYDCKVDVMYKLRDCSVELDFEGRTWLTVHEGNLLALKGLLVDEDGEVVFEGALTDEKPFGCPACVEGCTSQLFAEASECVAQAVFIRFHRAGKRWQGLLQYTHFTERFEGTPPDRHVAGFDRKSQSYQVVLVPRGVR
ncbi:MAG TPA: hypothetical protein VFS43_34710 [Polyangiaceae bacterium]|nr:hypothetical protein [Polyangiaceae bacterium]